MRSARLWIVSSHRLDCQTGQAYTIEIVITICTYLWPIFHDRSSYRFVVAYCEADRPTTSNNVWEVSRGAIVCYSFQADGSDVLIIARIIRAQQSLWHDSFNTTTLESNWRRLKLAMRPIHIPLIFLMSMFTWFKTDHSETCLAVVCTWLEVNPIISFIVMSSTNLNVWTDVFKSFISTKIPSILRHAFERRPYRKSFAGLDALSCFK